MANGRPGRPRGPLKVAGVLHEARVFKYGYAARVELPDHICDGLAFKDRRPGTGLTRFEHFCNYASVIWPEEFKPSRWNAWTERTLKELCDDTHTHVTGGVRVKTTFFTGCAAASKTWSVGMYAFAWFSVSPADSIVIFTSTSVKQIRRRIWPVVQHFHDTAQTGCQTATPWPMLNKVENKTIVQYVQPSGTPSDKNAIFALAVAEGETQKAAHDLRGMHADRILLVIDEANGTPEAILETIPNLRKGCRDLQIVVIGNPISRLDVHGQACCPVNDWSSVTEDTHSWLTRGVDRWQLESGVCLRFDGADSPNVRAGQDRWPFLYSCADWALATKSKKDTLAYWSQDRGLHPPEGFCKTIISEPMLAKYDPVDGQPFRWLTQRETIAFLDSGFGGDACKLAFGEMGDIEGGKIGLQVLEIIELTFPQATKEEIDYIIARRCKEECRLRNVQPKHFGLDRTGTGRGVAAIIAAEWSSDIHQVEYGSTATERPSSTADGRPSREVYFNRVTEMWWSAREFLTAGQLRGIPLQARIELTTREYDHQGRRYKLESKTDYKARILTHSPDDADALTGLVDVVRQQGVRAVTVNTEAVDRSWDKLIADKVFEAEQNAASEFQDTESQTAQMTVNYASLGPIDMFDEAVSDGW